MEKNSYQAVWRYLFDKLNNGSRPLDKNRIQQEIENLRMVIEAVQLPVIQSILAIDEFIDLEDGEWSRMKRDFESHFDVEMKHGDVIQGNEQQLRDTTWWTSVKKQETDLYYWNRYREHLFKSLPPTVVNTTDDDTDIVMNNLENPETERFSRYGMVVGHVQSGKTGNYSSLVCKAADAGYKFIVVVAGGMNNLRDQTQERMNESFVGYDKGTQVGAGVGNGAKGKIPLSLTTVERDFNRHDADRLSQGINFETVNVPVLLVIKKNVRTLKSVIEWLEKQYKNNDIEHAMLVVDDESDNASINTKEEDDPTSINLALRKLLSLFKRSAYVAYTATPYANIFIDHKAAHNTVGNDLFPKDFIYALDAPTNYFGARKIFIDSERRHLVAIDEDEKYLPYSHNKEFRLDELPDQLLDAIRLFIINIAIRRARGQSDKHNSMLIHATRFTDVHKNLAALTANYMKSIKDDIVAFIALPDVELQSVFLKEIKETYYRYHAGIDITWERALKELDEFIEGVLVREVHTKTVIPLEYRKDRATNAIVIGGASLARGFTVEGLSVSYFLRNTVFYDTLMQMGRWFGYRPGYEDLCRIFMHSDRITDFAEIITATESLVEDFRLMAANKKTPDDFGLYITENPDSALQITARNKQKHMEYYFHSMRLDGSLKETSYLSIDNDVIAWNLNAVRKVLDLLPPVLSDERETHVWRDVDRSVVRYFVDAFKTYDRDKLGLTSRMPIGFIREFIEERETNWDVAIYSGGGGCFGYNTVKIKKQERQYSVRNGAFEILNRQVSSGSSEAVPIEDAEALKRLKNDRKKARAYRKRPLLMLHILEMKEKNGDSIVDEIAAFGISFSGDALSDGLPVRLMVNTVFFDQLVESLKDDVESDD